MEILFIEMSECNLCGTCRSGSKYYCGNSWLRCIKCGRTDHEDHFYKTLSWPNAICEYCYGKEDSDLEMCDFCECYMKSKKLIKSIDIKMCHECITKNKKVIDFTIENKKKIREYFSN